MSTLTPVPQHITVERKGPYTYYTGTREDLIAARVADETMFPEGRKRIKSHCVVGPPTEEDWEMRRQPGSRFTLQRWHGDETESERREKVSWTALYYQERLLHEARTTAASLLEFAQQGWGGQRLARADCDKLKEVQACVMTALANGRVERIKRERFQVIAGGEEDAQP